MYSDRRRMFTILLLRFTDSRSQQTLLFCNNVIANDIPLLDFRSSLLGIRSSFHFRAVVRFHDLLFSGGVVFICRFQAFLFFFFCQHVWRLFMVRLVVLYRLFISFFLFRRGVSVDLFILIVLGFLVEPDLYGLCARFVFILDFI